MSNNADKELFPVVEEVPEDVEGWEPSGYQPGPDDPGPVEEDHIDAAEQGAEADDV